MTISMQELQYNVYKNYPSFYHLQFYLVPSQLGITLCSMLRLFSPLPVYFTYLLTLQHMSCHLSLSLFFSLLEKRGIKNFSPEKRNSIINSKGGGGGMQQQLSRLPRLAAAAWLDTIMHFCLNNNKFSKNRPPSMTAAAAAWSWTAAAAKADFIFQEMKEKLVEKSDSFGHEAAEELLPLRLHQHL